MEAIQGAFQLGTVEPHEEEYATFALKKPVRMNPDGSLKHSGGNTSDNFIEKTTSAEGRTTVDVYINSPWGTFVALYHVLTLMVSETDEVNIYLNSGIYSDDASLILGSMSLCKAPITAHVGYVSGFYGACVVAAADKHKYTKLSALALSSPQEYFTLRGMGSVKRQIQYMERSVKRFTDIVVNAGLVTKEELEEIILNNKQILLKRDDLAGRLSDISSATS